VYIAIYAFQSIPSICAGSEGGNATGSFGIWFQGLDGHVFELGILTGGTREPITSVHIWQGSEDYYAPVTLQSYIARSLPWIHYHELLGKGHFLPGVPGYNDDVVRHLLLDDTKMASAK
jgi:hypothetical protein